MKSQAIKYPKKVTDPVRKFLKAQLELLETRRKHVDEDDPFNDPKRAIDNASTDTDAEEIFGHDRASAVRDHLDNKIDQTKKALERIKTGKYGVCSDCGETIDTERLMIKPEATLCVKCESKLEKKR